MEVDKVFLENGSGFGLSGCYGLLEGRKSQKIEHPRYQHFTKNRKPLEEKIAFLPKGFFY
ncbi:MAG: hypothetical protein ACI8YQ_002842 [Polaribacter sp.]